MTTSTAPEAPPLRVAVIGAGLVGSAAVLSLLRLDSVRVTGYEKAPVSREAGAWISVPSSSLRVLTRLIPSEDIDRITFRSPDNGVYATRHWRTGEEMLRRYSSTDTAPQNRQGRTHRPPLLAAIVGHIPPGTIRYGHRIVDLRPEGSGNRLVFEDGSQSEDAYDLVVAADGIYSTIRAKFHPDHRVGYKGVVAYRSLFPKFVLAGIEGLHDDTSAWRSDDSVIFLSEVGLGVYGVVVIRPETAEYASTLRWETSIPPEARQRLLDKYANWDPVVGRVLAHVQDFQAYPLESGKWLEDLTRNGNVAFIGDAAHPTAGAYGAGAAMGFGDGWALSRALEATQSRHGALPGAYNVGAALDIFQGTRAPFLLRVERQMPIDALDSKYIAAAEDEEEWIRRFKERNTEQHWLTDHDVELEVQKVIAGYRGHKSG